jgi:hypothetical protein
MGNRYVNSTITRETKAVSQAGFGTGLLLVDTAKAYKEYSDLPSVAADFTADTVAYKKAAAYFGQVNKPTKLAIHGAVYVPGTDAATELSDTLNALLLAGHDDFYYLMSVFSTKAEIEELDKWTATQDRLYFATTQDQTVVATGDNTFIMISDVVDNHLAEALVGYIAPLEIGSYTVQFKQLGGVKACAFDTTDINAIHAKNFATYIREGGVNIVSAAKSASGEFIDIIQSAHYLNARITESVFQLLVTTPKVPFTNGGIATVGDRVEVPLKDGYNNGIIADENGAPLYNVTYPTRAEISATDRANRLLPDLKWTATIAGAVHDVEIGGTLQI